MHNRNEIIGILNDVSYTFELSVEKINKIYGCNLVNIIEVCKRKIFDLEDIFEKKDCSFYEETVLLNIIIDYFDSLFDKATNLLKELNFYFNKYYKKFSFNYFLLKFILSFQDSKIREYRELCMELSTFSLDDRLDDIICNYFNKLPKLEDVIANYINLQISLYKLGLTHISDELTSKLITILNSKEKESKHFLH